MQTQVRMLAEKQDSFVLVEAWRVPPALTSGWSVRTPSQGLVHAGLWWSGDTQQRSSQLPCPRCGCPSVGSWCVYHLADALVRDHCWSSWKSSLTPKLHAETSKPDGPKCSITWRPCWSFDSWSGWERARRPRRLVLTCPCRHTENNSTKYVLFLGSTSETPADLSTQRSGAGTGDI